MIWTEMLMKGGNAESRPSQSPTALVLHFENGFLNIYQSHYGYYFEHSIEQIFKIDR